MSDGVIGAVRQALADTSAGLGTPMDAPPNVRLQNATSLLSVSNPKWLASGGQLGVDREQDPSNADTALQWCLHLFARLVLTSPFNGMSLEERDQIESEIEATVLECLPAIEANPVPNLAAAKLLYFINRGHLELAEDLAERAFARTSDFAAALPILGQLRGTRGKFHDAVILFDRGIEMADPPAGFVLHMQVLKCIALLAADDRAALNAAASVTDLSSDCPPEIAVDDPPDDCSGGLQAAGRVGAGSCGDWRHGRRPRDRIPLLYVGASTHVQTSPRQRHARSGCTCDKPARRAGDSRFRPRERWPCERRSCRPIPA